MSIKRQKKECVFAVDLGATNVRVALIDKTGKIIAKKIEKTLKTGNDGSVVTNQIIRNIKEIQKEVVYKVDRIGVSAAGPLDINQGIVKNHNMGFLKIPIVAPLKEAFVCDVYFNNDANTAVVGEQVFGIGKNIQNIVYVTISSGIGAGVIVDGRLLNGSSGNVAEVGHFIVDSQYEQMCSCEKGFGHWEGLCSGNNIPLFFENFLLYYNYACDFKGDDIKEIFKKSKEGNIVAQKFVDTLGRINGRGLSNLIVAYDPQIIVFGGSVVTYNHDVIIPLMKKYADRFLDVFPKITVTQLGDDVSLFGAAAIAFKDGNV